MPEAKPILIKKDVPEFDKVNDSTYKLSYNKNAEVEIGNISEEGFHPHAKIKRWKDGSSFSLELSKSKVTSLKEEEGKIKCEIGAKKEIHYYPLDKKHQMEEGGLEVEVVLKSKPTTNVIEFDIDNENFAFYKQLPYNKQTESPEDKAAGVVKRTETQGLDKDDNVIVEMPENAVNSYAVYHKTKFDGVYRTGKAFHIYRPKAVDKNGKETWCDLNIETVSKKLTVTVPQTFINNATYPVKVDPTFGYTTLGSYYIYISNCIIGRNAEPSDEHGIVNSMHAGLDTSWDSGDKVKMALYNLKGSLISPQTIERDQGHDTCQFVHFPIDATPAKCPIRKICYIIAWWSDQSVPIRRDYGSSGSSRYSDTTYGTWPENVNWSLSSYIYSTYAQYEFENYNDWNYRKEVVIDTTNAGAEVYNDVSDIPILLRLDSSNFDFSQVKADGTDLRFSKSDGTKLYYARERWDSVNEKAEIWVYLDTVNGYSTTTIKMYWGKSDSPDTSMPKAVFYTSDDFEGAWHLDEGTGNTAKDETYNENNGTYNGDLPDQKDGVIYKSQDFDGDGDYISLPDSCNVTSQWTLGFWIKPNNPDDYERIFIQGAGACASMQIVAYWLNGHIEFGWTDTGTCTPDIASGAIPNGLWTHVVWTFNGTTHKVYVNGVSSSISPTGSNIFVDGDVYIGCRGGTHNFWTGELDELWLISDDRSADFVKLVYETQRVDQSATIKFRAPLQPCLWAEVDPGVTDDIYREDGNVGIGAFSDINPPEAKLEVRGDVRLGYDNAVSNPGPSIIMVPPPVMSGPTMAEQNRQNIQNAIDQAAYNNGGTVVLQKGTYRVNRVDVGTPGQSGSYSYGILIKLGVHLIGCSMRGTSIEPNETGYGSSQHFEIIRFDGSTDNPNFHRPAVIKELKVNNWDYQSETQLYSNITGIDIGNDYNANDPQPVYVESVFVDGCDIGFLIQSWFTELHTCKIYHCIKGINLYHKANDDPPDYLDSTNCTGIYHCHFWWVTTGIYVRGVNNQIIGCDIGGINNNGYGIHIDTTGSRVNYIAGNYIETSSGGTGAIGIRVESVGNTIQGNYFDLPTFGNEIEFSNDSIKTGNVLLGNYSGKTALDNSINSKTHIRSDGFFDKVLFYNGTDYIDDTEESVTSGGTAYTVLGDHTDDLFYIGSHEQFSEVYFDIAPPGGAGVNLSAEYYNGSTWASLTITDGTSNLNDSGTISFTKPGNWDTEAVDSSTLYWIRLKSTTYISTAPTAFFTIRRDKKQIADFEVYDPKGNSHIKLYGKTGGSSSNWINTAGSEKLILGDGDYPDTLAITGGNVGIGTINPSGTLQLESSSDYGTQLRIKNTSDSGREYTIVSTGHENLIGAGCLLIRDENDVKNRFIIRSEGQIGIGEIYPKCALDIDKDAGGDNLGYIRLEELSPGSAPEPPGSAHAAIYMRAGHLCAKLENDTEHIIV